MIDITECLNAVALVNDLRNQGVIAVYPEYVHLKRNVFLKSFTHYDVELFRDGKMKTCRYELSTWINGIKFMCFSENNPKEVTHEFY